MRMKKNKKRKNALNSGEINKPASDAEEDFRGEVEELPLDEEYFRPDRDYQAALEKEKRAEKMPRRFFLAGIAVALVAVFLVGSLLMNIPFPTNTSRPDSLGTFHKIREIENLIRSRYNGEIDGQKQSDYMLLGLVAGLGDKYAAYYTKEEYEEIAKEREGKMTGVGITITEDAETGDIEISAVMENSPAEEAGVQKGDILTAIDGESLEGKSTSDASDMIKSSEDETVTLTLTRDGGEPFDLTMKKEEIEVTAVSGKMLEGGIGYIQISSFNGVTSDQFKSTYEELKEDGLESLVIDLRDNPGGLVSACCDTLEQILPKGVIVYEEDKDGNVKTRKSAGKTPIDIPLVLLVNENTASSSEIFTGAVRDYDLCTIVGKTTYGKGIEQNSYKLSDGSVLKITTTHYYTPDHDDINGVGIEPDVEVEENEDAVYGDLESDNQLQKAVELLREEMSDN